MIHSSQEWQGIETLSVLVFIADRKNRKPEMMMSIHTKLYKRIFRFYHIVFTKLTLNSYFFWCAVKLYAVCVYFPVYTNSCFLVQISVKLV